MTTPQMKISLLLFCDSLATNNHNLEAIEAIGCFHPLTFNAVSLSIFFFRSLVLAVIKCVSFGEIIERDRTVTIRCTNTPLGIPYCGWSFQCTYGLHPNQIDFSYIPFEGSIQSSISRQEQRETSSLYKCIGGSFAQCTCPSVQSIHSFPDLYKVMRTDSIENLYFIFCLIE